jgi:hypothetical protein
MPTETDCGSCGKKLVLTSEGRYPEHPGKAKRGICGGSHLLPFAKNAE